jgi:hypothetical protein
VVSIFEKLRISHLGKAAEKEFGAAGVISLFNPCSVPCSFPVRSLLRISSVRQKNLKMPMESRLSNAWREKTAVFSLYFSLLTGIRGRDGFAGDWHHRQQSDSSENCSLVSPEFGAFRRFRCLDNSRYNDYYYLK